jgi:energy-coupling factor transporter ATP-binding protein EcfA2
VALADAQGAIMNIDLGGKLALEPRHLVGESVTILGLKGSGKSTTAAVLVEEIIESVPLTIIDPEGEYWGLKQRYQLLIAGCGDGVELQISAETAPALAEFSHKNGLSIILDLSGFDLVEAASLLRAYLGKLWEVQFKDPKPRFILLEEAFEFIPQQGDSPVKELLTRIALRGRKRGLGLIVVNQRSSNISKNVLTQAGMYLLHRVAHNADMTIYKDLIPLPPKEVEERVRGLQPGQALFVRGVNVETVTIRPRHTFHGGATPELNAGNAPQPEEDRRDPAEAAARTAEGGGCEARKIGRGERD